MFVNHQRISQPWKAMSLGGGVGIEESKVRCGRVNIRAHGTN